MSSICFDCKNARADKCEKVRFGNPVKGWTAKETEWGYAVKACPNFRFDYEGYQRIRFHDLSEKLKVSIKTMRTKGFEWTQKEAHKVGYSLMRVTTMNGKRFNYYIKKEGR